jgi:hypothetical protein
MELATLITAAVAALSGLTSALTLYYTHRGDRALYRHYKKALKRERRFELKVEAAAGKLSDDFPLLGELLRLESERAHKARLDELKRAYLMGKLGRWGAENKEWLEKRERERAARLREFEGAASANESGESPSG